MQTYVVVEHRGGELAVAAEDEKTLSLAPATQQHQTAYVNATSRADLRN